MEPVTAALLLGGLGAASGYLQGREQQRMNYANMMANAAQMRYSPWTGMKPAMMPAQAGSPVIAGLGGALSGGVSGYLMGQQAQKPQAPMAQPEIQQQPQEPMGQMDSAWLDMKRYYPEQYRNFYGAQQIG